MNNVISEKLRGIQWQFMLFAVIFFLFGVAILFFPTIVQYLFVIGFFVLSFVGFAIALRIKHLADFVENIFGSVGKKK